MVEVGSGLKQIVWHIEGKKEGKNSLFSYLFLLCHDMM